MATRLYFLNSAATEPKPNIKIGGVSVNQWQVGTQGGGQDSATTAFPLDMSLINNTSQDVIGGSATELGYAHQSWYKSFISPPLDVNQVIAGSATFVADYYESSGNLNLMPYIFIYIWKADDSDMRGTLLSGLASVTEADALTSNSQTFLTNIALTSINASAGDRIVVEVRSWDNNTKTNAYTHQFLFNHQYSYLEFSQNITFVGLSASCFDTSNTQDVVTAITETQTQGLSISGTVDTSSIIEVVAPYADLGEVNVYDTISSIENIASIVSDGYANINDNIISAETVTGVLEAPVIDISVSVNDAANIAEDITTRSDLGTVATHDTVSVVENLTGEISDVYTSIFDSISTVEALTASSPLPSITAADNIIGTENLVGTVSDGYTTTTDINTVSEAITAGVADPYQSSSDLVSVIESIISIISGAYAQVNDSISQYESVSSQISDGFADVNDLVMGSENIEVTISDAYTLILDSINTTDFISVALEGVIVDIFADITDSIITTDGFSQELPLSTTTQTIIDILEYLDGKADPVSATTVDTITLAEWIESQLPITGDVVDLLTISEWLQTYLDIKWSDSETITITDFINSVMQDPYTDINDVLNVLDSLTLAFDTYNLESTDTVSAVEWINVNIEGVTQHLFVSVNDNISYLDNIEENLPIFITITDDSSVTTTIEVNLPLEVIVSDIITIAEYIEQKIDIPGITFTDILSIAEYIEAITETITHRSVSVYTTINLSEDIAGDCGIQDNLLTSGTDNISVTESISILAKRTGRTPVTMGRGDIFKR